MDVDERPGNRLEDQLATKLVRYALSCEFSRTPIRRQAIRDKGTVSLKESQKKCIYLT